MRTDSVRGRDFITLLDWSKEEIGQILDLALELKQDRSIGRLHDNILRAKSAFHNLAHHAEILPILPTFKREIGSYDTAQLPYIIELGEKEAERQIPYLKRLLR